MCLLHLLVGVSQSRDDRLGAVVRCTKLVHRIVEGVVLLHVRRRLCGVHSESKIAGSVGGDAFESNLLRPKRLHIIPSL